MAAQKAGAHLVAREFGLPWATLVPVIGLALVETLDALGLSKVYVWQLRNGKRESIDGKAARKIEQKTSRPKGWMDTDIALWPFPGIELDRYLRLTAEQRVEIQGSVRKMIIDFEESSAKSPGEEPQPAFVSSGGIPRIPGGVASNVRFFTKGRRVPS